MSYDGKFEDLLKAGPAKKVCMHHALRKKRDDPEHGAYAFNAYVCGSCATIFEVNEHVEPDQSKPEPFGSESKVPWGLRGRQA